MPLPEPLAGQVLPASQLAVLAVRDTYEPELTAATTNPDLGVFGAATGDYYATGQLVYAFFDLQFGTSGASAGSGQYQVSMPPGLPIAHADSGISPIGRVRLRDDSAADEVIWDAHPTSGDGTTVTIRNPSSPNSAFVTSSAPWTWGNEDRIRGHVIYLTDA